MIFKDALASMIENSVIETLPLQAVKFLMK
jgi:hypothetical protein